MNQAELQELYRALREDWDQQAFEALCEHVRPILIKHIESQPPGTFGHSRDPEGPVAEVLKEFADAFQNKKTDNRHFKPSDFNKFLGHLKMMAMRRANDSYKGHKARGVHAPAPVGDGDAEHREPLVSIPVARPGPATEVAARDQNEVVREIIEKFHGSGQLSDDQVEALKMKIGQGMNLQSIASTLGLSKDQVRTLVRNALNTLSPELTRRLDLDSKGKQR